MNLLNVNLDNLNESSIVEKSIYEAVSNLVLTAMYESLNESNLYYQLIFENRFGENNFGERIPLFVTKEQFAEIEEKLEDEFNILLGGLKQDAQQNWIFDESTLSVNGVKTWNGGLLYKEENGKNIPTFIEGTTILENMEISFGSEKQTITKENPLIGLETYTTKISKRLLDNGYLPNAVLHRGKGIQLIVEIDNNTKQPIGKKRVYKIAKITTEERKQKLIDKKGELPTSIDNLCNRFNKDLDDSKFVYQSGVCESFSKYVEFLQSQNYSLETIQNDNTLGWYLNDLANNTDSSNNPTLSKEHDFSTKAKNQQKEDEILDLLLAGDTVKFATDENGVITNLSKAKQRSINAKLIENGKSEYFTIA